MNFVGKGAPGWQVEGKAKGKGRFEGVCWNCGKPGPRSREGHAQEGKWKDNGNAGSQGSNGGYEGETFKGKGEGHNVFDGYGECQKSYQPYAPARGVRPSPATAPGARAHAPQCGPPPGTDAAVNEHDLGYDGNFGGLSLCTTSARNCSAGLHGTDQEKTSIGAAQELKSILDEAGGRRSESGNGAERKAWSRGDQRHTEKAPREEAGQQQ